MKASIYPDLRKTAEFMRSLGYSERSIREITGLSRREIIRHGTLIDMFRLDVEKKNPKGGGGTPCML